MARVPLYQKAETEMRRRIRSGEWDVGLRLPNEFILAEEFKVSQGTMRRALITLETEGLLARKPGRGTHVASPNARANSGTPTGAGHLTLANGGAADFEVFRSRTTTRRAEEDEAALFGAARVIVVERTLKLSGARAALDEVVLPEASEIGIDGESAVGLMELLGAHGLSPATVEDQLSADMCSMSDSVALSVDRHTALLVLTRTAKDGGGHPIARQTLKLVGELVGYQPG